MAEHHALGGVASSAPEVLIGHVAAATEHLRVGSGGVLLPNHRPVHVAEQFCTLEALHPGRIDLGIGRPRARPTRPSSWPSSAPATTATAAASTAARRAAGLRRRAGTRPRPPSGRGARHARRRHAAPVFLLGSTPNSAVTAARKGLGYAFAAYTNPDHVADALKLYRREFIPARPADRPHAILGAKVIVGEDTHTRRPSPFPPISPSSSTVRATHRR